MGGGNHSSWMTVPPPTVTPPLWNIEREDQQWMHFDNSVNAVSFGFVATAILISMFLVMAIFERFLRQTSSFPSSSHPPPPPPPNSDLEAQIVFHGKLDYPSSPSMTVYAKGVSVLMPGDEVPTFIAHPAPAPAPCPPEPIVRPLHHHSQCFSFASGSTTSPNPARDSN